VGHRRLVSPLFRTARSSQSRRRSARRHRPLQAHSPTSPGWDTDRRPRPVNCLPTSVDQEDKVVPIREQPDLSARVGVAPLRVEVTGYDAIKLANSLRRPGVGGDIGIYLRVAVYSRCPNPPRSRQHLALQSVARNSPPVSFRAMIAEYCSQGRRCTLPLFRGFPQRRRPLGRFVLPQDVAVRSAGAEWLSPAPTTVPPCSPFP
jgi:hypothetical protein